MPKCTTCLRDFSTKGSLTRHQQSHQKSRQYTCSQCDVIFYRQDLLTRHMRMHEPAGVGTGSRSRLKSRTACDSCRHARTKCDGNRPCTRCRKSGARCSFTPTRGRVSTDQRIARPTSASDVEVEEDVRLHEAQNPASIPAEISPSRVLGDEALPSGSPLMSTNVNVGPLSVELNSDTFTPEAIAWPWLHEDIFLQSDINLDWYDFLGGTDCGDEGLAITENTNSQEMRPELLRTSHENCIQMDEGPQGPMFGDDILQSSLNPIPINPQENLVKILVTKATQWTKKLSNNPESQANVSSYYTEMETSASEIASVFGLAHNSSTNHCLHGFVELYLEHFWNLWPLFPKYGCKDHSFHPLLHLTMASIGAMYGGKKASVFGTMLHETLREALLKPFYDYDISEHDSLPLGQARSLTQAAALYFGQKRAFSYAQHIGGVLIAQGRKMNLFSVQTAIVVPEHKGGSEDRWLRKWIRRESCKRLAFAILRLEMYTSCLHSTRPMLSAEEMEIELPCSRFLWYEEFSSAESFISAIHQEYSMKTSKLLFADLVRIALDPNERLPHVGFLDQELLMNAIQEYVWRACASRHSLERLLEGTNAYEMELDDGISPEPGGIDVSLTRIQKFTSKRRWVDDHLLRHPRIMSTLQRKHDEVSKALRKWHEYCLVSVLPSQMADRSSLLSCLLVYHLGFLQMHAPIELIHIICHLPLSPNTTQHKAVSKIRDWSSTKRALAAVQHATTIFSILKHEGRKAPSSRASFNFLTMVGLYHSAALCWVYAGIACAQTDDHSLEQDARIPKLECGDEVIEISRPNMSSMMKAFVALYHEINPAWAPRSSFCTAIQRLSQLEFPVASIDSPTGNPIT